MILKPSFNKSAQDILKDRYFWKDENGLPTENAEQMLLRIANCILTFAESKANKQG